MPDEEDEVQEEPVGSIQGKKEYVYRWRKMEPPQCEYEFKGASILSEEIEVGSPISYWKRYWDDSITERLTEQTNLYSVQCTGASINTTNKEIDALIGADMLMSIVPMSRYSDHWRPEFRNEHITKAFVLKRYETLRRYLHVVDNNTRTNTSGKLFKIKIF